MRILITGGAGFIGSHLAERLINDGHELICLDNLSTGSLQNINKLQQNKSFRFIRHDISKPVKISGNVGAIFHLASPASPNHHSKLSYLHLPLETMLVNTLGTLHLLRLARQKKAMFLFASTSEVYGDPAVHPQNEEYNGNVSTTGPRSVYDESKRFGETLTMYYFREKSVDVRIARIFNTYGPRMLKADMRMIISFITQALENKPLTVFGRGTQTRSLCYVDDLVEGLIRLMFRPKTQGEIINLGAEEEFTVKDYASMVIKLTDSKSKIIFSEKLPEDDPKKRKPDIAKAWRILEWKPKVNIKLGLVKMIEYCKKTL